MGQCHPFPVKTWVYLPLHCPSPFNHSAGLPYPWSHKVTLRPPRQWPPCQSKTSRGKKSASSYARLGSWAAHFGVYCLTQPMNCVFASPAPRISSVWSRASPWTRCLRRVFVATVDKSRKNFWLFASPFRSSDGAPCVIFIRLGGCVTGACSPPTNWPTLLSLSSSSEGDAAFKGILPLTVIVLTYWSPWNPSNLVRHGSIIGLGLRNKKAPW